MNKQALFLALMALPVSFSVLANEDPVLLLEPVLVTATLGEVSQRDAPAASSIITEQQIKQSSARDLQEILSESTGISTVGLGVGNRKVINLRGMESHHTLIMINGRRISASDAVVGHSDFQNGWVSADAIERIEVVRGPLSSLYGSDGMGGVVNIITKKPGKEWSGHISLGTGEPKREGRESDLSLAVSGAINDRLSLRFDGAISDHEKTQDKDDSTLSEAEGSEVKSAAVSLVYELATNHELELYLSRSDEERPRDTLSRARVLHESTYDLESAMYSLEYKGQFEQTQVTVKAYQSSLDVKNSATNGVAPSTPQKLTDNIVEAHVTHTLNASNNMTAGIEYREEELEHEMMSGGEDSVTNHAFFLQDEMSLTESLALTVGARLDDHEIFGSELSPRAYLVYSLNDNWRIKGGYGEGFRAPTLKQISPNYRFEGFHTFVGNADLDPETSKTMELALQYYGPQLRAGLTLFRNDVDDLIQTNCIVNCMMPFGREFEYINVAEAQIDGVEFDVSYDFSHGFEFSLNMTHLDTENKTTGEELDYRPELSANTKLLWHTQDNSLSVSLRGQYIGEQVDDENKLPDYNLWHLNIYKQLNKTVGIKLGVDNIGDTHLADKSPDFSFEERGRFVYFGVDLAL